MTKATITSERLKQILAAARAKNAALAAHSAQYETQTSLEKMIARIDAEQPAEVDTSKLGITPESLATPEGKEAAVDIMLEVASSAASTSTAATATTTGNEAASEAPKLHGVQRAVTLNKQQQAFNDLVLSGKDCVLIGAAGTGKTTSMRTVTRNLIDQKLLPTISKSTGSIQAGTPGALILSFTRKAVNNIRHAVVNELKANTMTIHKVLEFVPEFFEVQDTTTGLYKKTMRFVPTRTRFNPLPADIILTAFEEGSMVAVELYNLLQDALPHRHQEIFLGDIQQLPPTFGLAVLGFKMNELPVIELTEIYRQAANSPIIDLAWKILKGEPDVFNSKTLTRKVQLPGSDKQVSRKYVPSLDALSKKTDDGSVFFQIWQNTLSDDLGLVTATKQFCQWADTGYYDPQDDIILVPYNKALGTIELNKGIHQHLGVKRQAVVHEIVAGFNKHYLAVGDRVLYDKEDATIISIAKNGSYTGKATSPASEKLDRWGHYQEKLSEAEVTAHLQESMDMSEEAIDQFMSSAADSDSEDRVQAASHVVTVKLNFGGEEFSLDTAGEINGLLGGHAITIHKAQGSEWKKVFFLLHNSHVKMVSRELLYTGVTRARQELHIICETSTFEKGVKSQRIKGNSLKEKAEFFKGKAKTGAGYVVPIKNVGLDARKLPAQQLDVQETKDAPVRENVRSELEKSVQAPSNPLTLAERLAALKAKAAK